MAEYYSIGCRYHIFFMIDTLFYLSTLTTWTFLVHILTIVNGAARNMGGRMSLHQTDFISFHSNNSYCNQSFGLRVQISEIPYARRHAVGRGRVNTQLIFSHLQGADMSYRFK
jgi:hypothetical protein